MLRPRVMEEGKRMAMKPLLTCAALVMGMASSGLAQNSASPSLVAGLGYVEPEGGVTTVAGGPSISNSIVYELKVIEGDTVKRADLIAVLGDNALMQAALIQAETRVKVQEAQLARVQAGAMQSELDAKEAVVDRLKKELGNVVKECIRQQNLYERKIISEAVFLQNCNRVDVTEGRLNEAEATLAAVATIRPEDILIAEAELISARANVGHARIALEGTFVRAPTDGTILKIHATAGERIGPSGLVDMGFVDRMWVSAEIYENDILKVKPGQSVSVIADGIDQKIQGVVKKIGLTVSRNELLSNNPTADVDARVVEVKILLNDEDSHHVAGLTNLQVSVVIHP